MLIYRIQSLEKHSPLIFELQFSALFEQFSLSSLWAAVHKQK